MSDVPPGAAFATLQLNQPALNSFDRRIRISAHEAVTLLVSIAIE